MTPPVNKPFTIRIFLPDGAPDGLRIVEKTNWTSKGMVCPRSLFAAGSFWSESPREAIWAHSIERIANPQGSRSGEQVKGACETSNNWS